MFLNQPDVADVGLIPPPLVLSFAIEAPDVTLSPSATSNSSITPECGELTFKFVLSVSISAIVSSAATLSPTFFKKRIVPSLTDSGNEGVETLTESTKCKLFNTKNKRRSTTYKQ